MSFEREHVEWLRGSDISRLYGIHENTLLKWERTGLVPAHREDERGNRWWGPVERKRIEVYLALKTELGYYKAHAVIAILQERGVFPLPDQQPYQAPRRTRQGNLRKLGTLSKARLRRLGLEPGYEQPPRNWVRRVAERKFRRKNQPLGNLIHRVSIGKRDV
jgi:DNA-binding transcriptional MerR regulator